MAEPTSREKQKNETHMKDLNQFIGLYPVSKTLRFELKPVLQEGQSIDDFWSVYLNGSEKDTLHTLYKSDKERNDNYPIMKALLDQFHKDFIASALDKFEEGDNGVTWDELASEYHKDKKSKEFQDLQKKMRHKIKEAFKKHDLWSYISSYSTLISTQLRQMVEDDGFVKSVQESNPKMELDRDKMLKAIETFKKFSVYFGNYKDNRANMYSEEAQNTSIANRIVNENLPKFLDNIIVYQRLKDICPDELRNIEANLSAALDGLSLDDVYKPEYYNKCLTQKGIERYNWILGGNPNENVLGINSIGNEYLQKHPDSNLKLRHLEMTKLYKQILSDRERIAFLPEQFNSDEELMNSVNDFFDAFDSINLFSRIQETMNILKESNTNLEKIYVQGSKLTKLSMLLYGKWDVLGEKLRSTIVNGKSKKAQKERDEEIGKWLENKCFSLAEIQAVEDELMQQSAHPLSLMELLTDLTLWKYDSENNTWSKKSLIRLCNDSRIAEFNVLMNNYKQGNVSIKKDDAKEILKSVLDHYMELLHVLELLRLGKKSSYVEKDDFYTPYELLFEADNDEITISNIVTLYMKVQGYLTRKLTDQGKILLKFDSPTRANGWDDCSIVIKDNKYYLVMYLERLDDKETRALYAGDSAKLVIYQQQKTDFRNAPRLFINSKGENRAPAVGKYNLPIEMVESLYKERKAIRSPASKKAFDEEHPDYNQKLIDYYKIGFLRHEDFAPFRHTFESMWKKSSEYDSIQEFFEHTQEMCYMLSFKPIAFDYLYSLQREKKILLFNITNKDLNEGTKGTPNIHTLYWKELFSKDNLADVVFKLSSQGIEFFYREANSQKTAFVHKQNSILVNKTLSNGTPIDGELYKRFVQHFNGIEVSLTQEEKKLLPLVKTKKAKFDITKDKRYYEHKFFIHVPITINSKASKTSQKQFNQRTLDIFRCDKKDLNIIGIDRGERNLIYVSVINQKGENLIPPRHYNLIGNYDYLAKLKQTEKNREEARKNWTTMERIKDLKSGYLSQVIHEIAKLMVQYNAIIVLEDLNFGFKRGRFNVERQVYQNFEKMLIQKLNYLAFKKENPSQECGNIRSGLQLTAPFTSFKELGKQSGWLFYVPAGYTSKIDPSTGFVNLFNMNKPAENLQKFFGAFEEIAYRNGLFYFSFDYSKEEFYKVKTDYTNHWTLSSHGQRIVGKEKESKDLTKEFCDFFEKAGLPLAEVSVQNVSSLDDTNLQKLWGLFKLLLKMRNSNDEQDYIISPVESDTPFITGTDNLMQITDADANGAYNIALKGLYWLWNDFPTNAEGNLKYIKDEDWFRFIQTKPYLHTLVQTRV